jgi:hypothetical protein
MMTRVTRLAVHRRRAVALGFGQMVRLELRCFGMLLVVVVRGRTVMMSRVVVPDVFVGVQRGRDTRCRYESGNEQGSQKALHLNESMGGVPERQPTEWPRPSGQGRPAVDEDPGCGKVDTIVGLIDDRPVEPGGLVDKTIQVIY